ncbi:hypothetical protein PVK06_040091 [Gossypium arboreum]|uniref:SWIM-type domain-containing protein n=1 Tax=Gossypium arboreum TaxID=29729 RepID=A0ABR0N544_GOSAR|nr:hypothetical protein PVK06_040091 [Gossypium arboreum]
MHISGLIFDAGNTYWGMTSTFSGWQSISDGGNYETFTRRDDVLPITSTGEGTSAEVALFSEPEPVPFELENVEGGSDEEEKDPRFRAYSPPPYMHNVNILANDALEFLELPHRTHDCISLSFDSGDLEVDLRTSVLCIIANIRSQLRYMPSYRKAWIAKQKALEKMHSGLRRHVCPQPDIFIISDWGIGILAAIEQHGSLWDCTHHRCCLRYDINKDRFQEMLGNLRSVNDQCADYLCNIPFEQWTQAYDDSLRYGHITTNLVDCINFILKGTRHLPITSVVQETYFHLGELFPKTCDCGTFDALRYPCAHAIVACQNLHLDPMRYVNEVYKIENMYSVWRHVFPPVLDKRKWPSVSLAPFKLLPDRELHRKPKGVDDDYALDNSLVAPVGVVVADTTTPPELSTANEDPLELPVGLITRARAKRFKDATTTLVDRVWGETVAGLLESSWTSKPSKPCILLQAQISSNQLNFNLT